MHATSTSSDPCPISVAPQNAVTPPLRSSLSCTAECGRSFQLMGKTGAGQIRRAGETESAAVRQLAVLVAPAGTLDHALDAFGEADRADAQVVRRERIGRRDDVQAEIGRIHRQRVRDLVELHFLAEARLWRAVTALGPARRFVRENAAASESVPRDLVRHRLQRTGVEGACCAVRSVRAAVEQRLQIHARDAAIFRNARPEIASDTG